MATCDTCLSEYVRQDDLQPDDQCDDCAAWSNYWLSLTPAQQRAEQRAMDLHTSTEGL